MRQTCLMVILTFCTGCTREDFGREIVLDRSVGYSPTSSEAGLKKRVILHHSGDVLICQYITTNIIVVRVMDQI